MSTSKLMKVTYYDPKSQIRLLCYADTVVWDTKPTPTLTALRFGGYPERVQGLADAIYGGATIEIEDGKDTYSLKTLTRQYRRELSHDGVYAEATLIAEDDGQSAKQNAGDKDEPDKDKNDEDDDQIQQDLPPRNTYIFCTPGERRELFDAVDQKTAVPMIPEYQDYVLTELQKRNILRPLQVKSLSRKLEAWLLRCEEKDKNIVAVMEDGLKSGAISIPGATVGLNPLDEINSITEYKKPFIPVVTEYLLLFHKQDALFFPFAVRRETTVDLRKEDIPGLTWHHLIRLTMEELSGRAKLSDLGDRLAAHPKAKKNPHFRDRIRATAYEHPGQYISCGNGFYALNYAVA